MFQTNQYYDRGTPPDDLPQVLVLLLLLAVIVWFNLRPAIRAFRFRNSVRKGAYRPRAASSPRSGYHHPQATPLATSTLFKPASPDLTDPKVQMDAISSVEFETTPILNSEESRLLPILERATRDFGDCHRLMAQTSLGEVIKPRASSPATSSTRAAYASINSKRLDFIVINRFGHMVAAIEYQGTGHHMNRAFLRDAVKREAVRKAGVPYIEVQPDFDPEVIRNQLRLILRPGSRTT